MVRESAGVSVPALAAAIGINEASCWDLMVCEDKLACLSLREWLCAAATLRVDPLSLLGVPVIPASEHNGFAELSSKIDRHCADYGISIDQFGDSVGWAVRDVVEMPSKALDAWNFDCLRDVCVALGLHWPDFLPEPRSVHFS